MRHPLIGLTESGFAIVQSVLSETTLHFIYGPKEMPLGLEWAVAV